MKITCYYDSIADMGYIYLTPPTGDQEDTNSTNEIDAHISPQNITIPYITDTTVATFLDRMHLAPVTLKNDREGYDTEYGLDIDTHGYLTGIELKLPPEKFIDLISNQAIKVIQTKWKEKSFHLITFDHMDNVLNTDHVIYKLTNQEDAYVIVQLADPKKLGIQYFHSDDEYCPIALFKGLLSARDDIYPLEYLLKPQFIMRGDSVVDKNL